MNGNLIQSAEFYQEAIQLFKELNNRQGLASSLALQPLLYGSYHSSDRSPAFNDLGEAEETGRTSRRLAFEINWRAGEAFALFGLSFCLGYHGQIAKALPYATESLKIAEEIEHNQWLVTANCSLGMLHFDLLNFETAQLHLEQALAQAKLLNSTYWIHTAGGFLASLYIHSGQLIKGEEILTHILTPDTRAQSLGQRTAWQAQAELALAKGLPGKALEITGLLGFNPAIQPGNQAVLPTLLQAKILIALNRNQEAETILLETRKALETCQVRPLLWRVNLTLAELYLKLKRLPAAAEVVQATRQIITEITGSINDPALQNQFQRLALAQIPVIPAFSQRQVMKKAWAGLTEREREVALLVAQGKSNRQIAEALVLNKRTVESYLDHIFFKLNLSSRIQLAAWVFERSGLSQNK